MSMITEQINRLRKAADFRHTIGDYMTAGLHIEAADTIEQLAAKVRATNMERSTAYYNGGWIPVSEKLPDIHNYCMKYLVTDCHRHIHTSLFTESGGKSWWSYEDVIAWMPLPEPYREDGDTE